jgi:hypothetical protein
MSLSSIGSEQSTAYLDAANRKIDWINNNADAANSFLNFQQTIVAPELKSETSFGSNGVAGSAFVFDYCGDVRGELDTDITDHYSESTVFVQDHAILKPRMITLRGFVGELVARPPTGVIALLNTLTGNLTAVSGYLGKYTPGAVATMQKATTQAQNITNKINSIAAKGNGLLNLLGKNVAQSKQARAWAKLETMWAARIPMTVFTPTKVYNNMLIKSVVWTNPETTKYWSEIVITMKEIRTTGAISYKVESETTAQQTELLKLAGQTSGTPASTAALSAFFTGPR